jgi:hypothetical protein
MAAPPIQQQQQHHYHLLSLPEEHLPNIISYLTLTDICHLRLVSSYFHNTRHVHHLWMDQLDEDSHNTSAGRGIMTSRRLQRMLSIFPHIISLRIYGLQLLDRSAVTHRRDAADRDTRHYLEVIQSSPCSQNIECLELLGVFECDPFSSDWGSGSIPSYSSSTHVDVHFPKLRRLTIEGRLFHKEIPLIRSLVHSSTNQLTYLHLGGPIPCICDFDIEVAIMQRHNNTLEELIIDGNCGKIVSLTVQSTVLRRLNLSGCKNLTAFRSDSYCPNLEYLDLSHCSNMSPIFLNMKNIFMFSPRLRVLKLRCNTIIEEIDSTEGQCLTCLEHIDIRDCPLLQQVKITSPKLQVVEVYNNRSLKVLHISSPVIKTLSVAWLYSLEKLTLDCPALVKLDVTSCYKLNENGMQLNCHPALRNIKRAAS